MALIDKLTAIGNAIRSKTGTTEMLTLDGMVEAIEGMGSGGDHEKAPRALADSVNFYDYDGTLLYSYSIEEAQALSELPAGPTHDGLIFQAWNWSLEAIKSLTQAATIGAHYITDDGTTRIHISLLQGRTSPMMGLCVNGSVTIDWGDGSEAEILTGSNATTVVWTARHEYPAPGDYVIRLTIDGSVGLGGQVQGINSSKNGAYILRHSNTTDGVNEVYQNSIKKVECGSGITGFGAAFANCRSLEMITIPAELTAIGNYAFHSCTSLLSITIPDAVTSIGASAFSGCNSLIAVALPDGITLLGSDAFSSCSSLLAIGPLNNVTSIGGGAFRNCCLIPSIRIPDGITSLGSYTFAGCRSLKSMTLPSGLKKITSYLFEDCQSLVSVNVPHTVTAIEDYAFNECRSLTSITLPYMLPAIGHKAFAECHSLRSVSMPTVISILEAYAFYNCFALSSITLSTQMKTIESNTFSGCKALASVTMPGEKITSIGQSAFLGCSGVRFYDFTKYTFVPTLADTAAFQGIAADCEIRVPADLYDEWIAAANWSTYASNIVAV